MAFTLPRGLGQAIRTTAILAGAPILGGVLCWQLWTLEPKRYCGVAFDIAKADGAGLVNAFQACIGLQSKILDLKDHAIIGLLIVIGLGYIMVVARELRMLVEFKGPGGIEGKVGSDPAAQGAKRVADAAVNEAEDVAHGGSS